jgi:hemerythrin-like domain-containing protein
MRRTTLLRKQHDAALVLAQSIIDSCDGPADDFKAFRTSMLLAKLTGLLRIHFAQEDEVLYPRMEASFDADTSATARKFRNEMGGLSRVYTEFVNRWATSQQIASDFAGFKKECQELFTALTKRIERENAMLYPLADAIDEEIGKTG